MVDLRKQMDRLAKQDAELKRRKEEQELEKKLAPEKELSTKDYIKGLENEVESLRQKLQVAVSRIPMEKVISNIIQEGERRMDEVVIAATAVRGVQTTMVSVGNKDEQGSNSELKYEETEPRKVDLTAYSEVMWAQGVTLNIGNYESARIDVSIKEYCPVDKKEELLGKLKEFCITAIKNERLKIEEYRKRRT